jgi:Tol biopolymer transport system component
VNQNRSHRVPLLFPSLLSLGLLCFSGSVSAATIKNGLAPETCLESTDGANVAGSQLQLNACNGSQSQNFSFWDNGEIHLGSFCVDTNTGLGRNGDAVILSHCRGVNQQWKRSSEDEITGANGKCMDVTGAGPGSKVMVWQCRDAAGQKWAVADEVAIETSSLDTHLNFGLRSASVPVDPCAVKSFEPSPQAGLTVWSPDGSQYLVNKKDANGISQVYVGKKGSTAVCITCTDKTNGPKATKRKMQPHWHPSGRWIVLAVEQDSFDKPFYSTPEMIEGWLQSGIWVDMYATTPDGSVWYNLQDFGPSNKADGFTGVAFTPDGRKGVWAQIVDGNVFAYTFGRWELILADFQEVNGVPSFTNLRNITPSDTYWVEPGNFSANGKDLVLTADRGFADHSKVEGQDQYVLDVYSGRITNLTKSPTIWDEHGVFSPDGNKILFMSSSPFWWNPWSSTALFLNTEFMLMNKDGSNLRQISHFNYPGYPEYSDVGSVAANAEWSPDGTTLSALNLHFPNYQMWQITFAGACGEAR